MGYISALTYYLLLITSYAFTYASPRVAASCKLDMIRYDTCKLDMIRYDTRCYFNVQSKADTSQLNLPRGTNN